MKEPSIDVAALKRGVSLLGLLPRDAKPRKTGAQAWLARCSFHEDDKPSMSVRLADVGWVFHCFACGEHGTVVDYVMRTERLSFKDAIRKMAGPDFRALEAPPRKRLSELVLACDGPGCCARVGVAERDALFVGRGSGPWTVLPDGRAFCVKCSGRLKVAA